MKSRIFTYVSLCMASLALAPAAMAEPANVIDPVTCCKADPSGKTDSTEALRKWWGLLMASQSSGYLPGKFKHTQMSWDAAPRHAGVTIYGDGGNSSLICTETVKSCLTIYRSGGTSPSHIVSWVNLDMRDLTFVADTTGVAYRIGQDDGGDVLESSMLSNVNFVNNNTAKSTDAVTLRLNSLNNPVFNNVKINGNPATHQSPGYGDALQITQVIDDTWNSASISNANTAIRYTNLGNPALGFSHGGTWHGLDAENIQNEIVGESGAYGLELFTGGQVDLVYPGGYEVTSKAGFYGDTFPTFWLLNHKPIKGVVTIHPSYAKGVEVTSGNYMTTVKTAGYAVAALPPGTVGMRAYVTDQAAACAPAGTPLTGGGNVTCPVFYNGSAWVGD